ncbi:MAG: FecR domain-containing protein [Nibricoccus sp.]
MNTPEKIETEAALWVLRLERGLTAAEQDDFLQWFTADARHAQELDRQTANWTRLNTLADWRPEHTARPNRDLLAPHPAPRAISRKPRYRWLWPMAGSLAAAAAVVLGFLSLSPVSPSTPTPAPVTAPAQIAAIERRTLDDGTVIELNRDAEVAVLYTATERKVRLERGEAMFRVAKNPARPFIVITGDVHFRAVGTAFNVRRQTEAVELIVTEGKVRVQSAATEGLATPQTDSAETPLVVAGELAVVPMQVGKSPISVTKIATEQMDEKLAWHSRLLDFTNARLSAVVAEFNLRNTPIRMVIEDAKLADTEVSASLRSDNIESFIRLLEGGFGIEAERTGNVVTLHKRRR